MKCSLIFTVLLLAGASLASPINSRSNPRWAVVPDSEGFMHVVDLEQQVNEIEPAFFPDTDMFFLVFTRLNPTVGQRINFNDVQSVLNSNFNANHPTRFTIHGWIGDGTSQTNQAIREQYFIHGEYNMVTVDWGAGAMTNNYITARNRVPAVGAFLARFVDFLHANNFIRFETTHIIGHSLGGHVCGFAGKTVSRGRVQVIMSLDPAGPLFDALNPAERTAPTDGVYVEVIHTNGGTLGMMEPIGQADFYPSFGRSQPGCGVDVSGQCAHARVVFFYAESVNIRFTSRECASFQEIDYGVCTPTGRTAAMGGAVGNIGLTGNYHTVVNAQSPFSNGV